MALHVSGVCAHSQELQDLKLPLIVFWIDCVERRCEPLWCETCRCCGIPLHLHVSHHSGSHLLSTQSTQNTIRGSFKSCSSWLWAHSHETYKDITPSTIKLYLVASSWFFYSHMIKFNGYTNLKYNYFIFVKERNISEIYPVTIIREMY
jgi:hypothetical protein